MRALNFQFSPIFFLQCTILGGVKRTWRIEAEKEKAMQLIE